MEERLSIAPWPMPPNENNDVLQRGCREARHPHGRHPPQREGLRQPRLLRHGLPDERQAVDAGHDDSRGARPRRNARASGARDAPRDGRRSHHAVRGARRGAQRRAAACQPHPPARAPLRALPRAPSAAPACCSRARLPDPYSTAGKRTFLHPTVVSGAMMRAEGRSPRGSAPDHLQRPLPRLARSTGRWDSSSRRRRSIPILAGITLPGFGSGPRSRG